MEKVVLHINKAKGNDAGTTAHIERTVDPPNVDKTRTHLNKELVDFPEGITSRTQAIQYRIENAGIARRIRTDQVRAIRIMLSGTPETMKQIEDEGKLTNWSNDSIEWLNDTFGKENLVSAVLHLDEKTPHIHATVVPIVTGERRKAKLEENNGKKKYRKKDTNKPRLCADDVMTRDKLISYQDTYAEKMAKYGLQRGVKGSDARHITNTEYAKKLLSDLEYAKENITAYQEQKEEVKAGIWDLYDRKDEARDKFIAMDNHVKQKSHELDQISLELEQAKRELNPEQVREDFDLIKDIFPKLEEYSKWTRFCSGIGFSKETIKELFNGKAVEYTGKIYSHEFNRKFEAKQVTLKMEKDSKESDKLFLSINGKNVFDWFREKFKELQKLITPQKNRGVKL